MTDKKITFDQMPDTLAELDAKITRIEKALHALNKAATGKGGDELYNVKEAAEFLGLKPATVYSMVSRGEIPVSKRGRSLVFSRNRLIEWSLQGERG